jgi:hypothetical protein
MFGCMIVWPTAATELTRYHPLTTNFTPFVRANGRTIRRRLFMHWWSDHRGIKHRTHFRGDSFHKLTSKSPCYRLHDRRE